MTFSSIQPRRNPIETSKDRSRLFKSALPYFLIPFFLLTLFIFGFYAKEIREERLGHESRQKHQLDLLATELSHELRETASQLRVLTAHHELAAWIESDDDVHLANLTLEFTAFAEVMKEFGQVRLLDTSGMERVRVNYRNGRASVVPP